VLHGVRVDRALPVPAGGGAAVRQLPAAAVNVCPVCGQGEVRCAVGAGEQRQAIAEHLATRVEGVDVSLTSDGKTVVVLRQGRRPPQVVVVDPTAIAADPRAALDDLLVRLGGPAGPGTPYR
jgi:hypothetical protein